MEKNLSVSNQVFMSNRLDCLANTLIDQFLETKSLRTVIIIPSNTVKEFLLQHFNARLGYFAGSRFLTLPKALEYFAKLTHKTDINHPDHLSLMLHIESEIRKCRDPELLDYLQNDEEKIYSLAEEMSHVFLHYGVYGHNALKEWEKQGGWQQEIWRHISLFWDFPFELLSAKRPPQIPHVVHLFNLVHIPLLYSSLLHHLSRFWPTFTYFRSPTPLYWGDLLSEKRIAQSPELKSYDLETNPHLSNLGMLGKRLYSSLAEKEFEENYIPWPRDSALNCLKQDIFDLTCLEHPYDQTVEIHSSPTKMREVEILLSNLEKSGCEDVLVFAPNISDYFPHIQFVFEREECPFGYLVTDLAPETPNVLESFFSLAESRFEPKLILAFLSSPQCKMKEDLSLLHKITERVQWGYNQEMRQEVLECPGVSDVGTWDACFRSLLQSLAHTSSPIELSKAENLGNLIALLEGLYTDLVSLNKKKACLDEWQRTIEGLLEKYFFYSDEIKSFLTKLHPLTKIEGEFSYQSILRIIREILSSQKETRALLSKPTIRFASLKEGAICDADIICLLGIDEESFPRKNTFRSLNQLKYAKGADIQPENSEKDRYLLLEAMLSARKRLLFSYVNISPKDGKGVEVSLLLQKLCAVQTHSAFDVPKSSTPAAKKEFAPETLSTISFSSLSKLARDPIAFYCNETLGIYLDQKKEESEFILSYQEKARLRNEALFKGVDEIVENTNVLYRDTAKQELAEEVDELRGNLNTLDLRAADFYSLRFDLSCHKPTQLADGSIVYPPIKIDGLLIHGELSRLTPKGLFIFGKNTFAERWKYLPHLLIMKEMGLPLTLLFGKDATQQSFSLSKEALSSYVDYYREARSVVSPLLPDLAEKMHKGKKMSEPTSYFDNPYLDFLKPDLSERWETHFSVLCKNFSL